MSSLESCIIKAGKALSKEDANAIRDIRNDLYGVGDITRDEANRQAVAEYQEILAEERIEVMKRIKDAGGETIPITLSKIAAEYPRIGLQRASKDKSADLRSKRLPELLNILKYFDKQMADTLFEANKHINSKDDLNDFRELLIEHIEPFMEQEVIKYAASDIFEEDLANKYPDHPLAQVSKHGAMLQKAKDEPTPAVKKGFRAWMRSLVDKYLTITAILHYVPMSKLPDFIRFGMASVHEYIGTINEMNGFMDGQTNIHGKLANDWLDLRKKDTTRAAILAEFMHGTSLAGVDPLDTRVPTKEEITKMNKVKRKMWKKRLRNREILMKFWNGSLAKGDRAIYQKKVFNPITDELENVGSPMELSESQVMYLRVRDTYSNHRIQSIQALEDRIDASQADSKAKAALITLLRKQFEAGKIVPYFPFSRFGKYWATIKDKVTGEIISYNKFNDLSERNEFISEMRQQGYLAFSSEEQESYSESMAGVDPDFVAKVTSMVDAQAEDSKGLQDDIWQMYLRMLPEMSVRKHEIHRKGTLGFTTDALQSFGDYMFHGVHQLGKLKYGHILAGHIRNAHEDAAGINERADIIENMERHGYREPSQEGMTLHEAMMSMSSFKGDYKGLYDKYKESGLSTTEAQDKARETLKAEAQHDAPWSQSLANELEQRHGYVMNPKSAAWSTNLTAFGFLWFLSMSPAAGMLNLTQNAITAYPILRAKFNGMGAGKELAAALAEYSATRTVDKMIAKLKNDEGSKTTGEKAAMIAFKLSGMYEKTRSRDLMGFGQSGLHFKTGQARIMELAGWIFHKSEEANRVSTSMAAYRLARKKFSTDESFENDLDRHNAAVSLAAKMVENSHFDYANTNRPPIMQGDAGRVVFLFRNYSLNMTYLLARAFKDGIWTNPGIPLEERREARQRLGGILAMTGLFTGLSGMPLAWAVHGILSAVLGDEDDPFDSEDSMRTWMTEAWGERAAEIIHKGPWDALTGSTLSSRASLNNLWIREVPDSLRGKDLLLHLAGEGFGPILGIGINYMQGFDNLAEGHTDRAIERFVPKAVADVMKTIRFAHKGAQTYSKDLIMTPEEFTNRRLVTQLLGFTPSELTLRYEQNRALKDAQMRLKRRHSHLLNTLFMHYKLKDRSGARAALKEIRKWNRTNPRLAITPQTILRSARSRAQYDQRTVSGVALDKRMEYLRREIRFTDKDKRR